MEREVFGVPVRAEFAVSVVIMGPRDGESVGRVEDTLNRLIGLRGDTLRPWLLLGRAPFTESKLPCEMS